jgi:hypothetical protein
MAAFVDDQRIVRNGLLGPALVLRQVVAAVLLLDVQESCRAVVGNDFAAIVVEQPVKFVEMAVAHALRSRLEYERLLIRLHAMSQNNERALVAVRAVAEEHRLEVVRLGEACIDRFRQLEPVRYQNVRMLHLGNRQQRAIPGKCKRDGYAVTKFYGIESLVLDRVVEREEQTGIR